MIHFRRLRAEDQVCSQAFAEFAVTLKISRVCFQIFGADRIAQAAIQPGEELIVSFDIDSREYQGRWFTNINCWKVERPAAMPQQVAPGITPEDLAPSAPMAAPDFGQANPVDDLPF